MDPFWFYPFLSAFIRVIRVKGMFRLPGKSGGVQGFDFEGGGAGAAGLDGEFDRQDFCVLGHAPEGAVVIDEQDRKSTRLNSSTNAHLVCRLLLEKKKNKKTR